MTKGEPFSQGDQLCICGGPRRETQRFCFQCWQKLPDKTRYDLADNDSTKRTFAGADAQHFLETKKRDSESGVIVDRKTQSAGDS